MGSDDRLPKLMLLGLIALSLLSIHPGGTADPGDGPLAQDHVRISMAPDGSLRVTPPGVEAGRWPDLERVLPLVRGALPDAASRTPGAPDDPVVLEIVAPAERRWIEVLPLAYCAGHPAVQIATLRLVPRGHPAARVLLPVDPGHTGVGYIETPVIHVALGAGVVEVREGERAHGLNFFPGWHFEGEPPVLVVMRAPWPDPDALDALAAQLRASRAKLPLDDAFAVAVSWPSRSTATFADVVDVIRIAVSVEPDEFYFAQRAVP